MIKSPQRKRVKTDPSIRSETTARRSPSPSNQLTNTLLPGTEINSRTIHRGYGPATTWGGKYRYGTFSHLIAAYVLAYEFYEQLDQLDNWRREGPEHTESLVNAMKQRYENLSPGEVEMVVEMANRGLLGDTFEAHWWPIRDPVENLDFIENTMADFSDLESAPGFDTSRLNRHSSGEGDKSRLTLEPTDSWLSDPNFRGLEPDLHRGGYAPGMGIPHNSILAHLVAYIAGDRGVEMDILDTKDYHPIVAHDFALNRLTGEYFLPRKLVAKMLGREVVQYNLGIPHVDRDLPNALRSNFHISYLKDFFDFHKKYIPGMHMALDARNFSSITAINSISDDIQDAENSESYNPNISVKIYPFTISHGFDHMVYEYAARAGAGRTGMGEIAFEEMKYFKPEGFNESLVPSEFLSVAEKEKIKKRKDRDDLLVAIRGGENKEEQYNELSRTLSRIEKLESLPAISDELRLEFENKSKKIHVILCVGGVATADIDVDQKAVGFKYPIDTAKIKRNYQGSESVVALAIKPKYDDDEWKLHLPFGGMSESYFEHELKIKHGMNPFSQDEIEYLRHETFRVFQWIATFMGKVHSKSGIQFQSSASISDVLQFINNIKSLKDRTDRAAAEMDSTLPEQSHLYRSGLNDSNYMKMSDFENSGLKTRFKLLTAAVIQNVQHLIARAAEGSLNVQTNALYDNSAQVKEGFSGLYYYGTDRFPDLMLAKRGGVPSASSAEQKLFDIGERLEWPELGNAPLIPRVTEAAKRWVYFVVDGRVDVQAGPGFSNELGGTTGQTLGVSAATTDMPVPHRLLAFHGILNAGLPSPRRYWEHMRTVFRPDIRTDSSGEPAGIARWAGNPFVDKAILATQLGVPVDSLAPYAAPEGMQDLANKRKRTVDAVKRAK